MKLIIEDDEGHKTTVPFVRDEITVGREEGNTIRLTERNISRRHARFFKQSGQIYVEDLRSFNGIKVNGDRIEGSVQLSAGDLVQIGDFDLAVQGEVQPNGANGRASQATEQMPALDVDTVNMPAPEIERDPSKPAAPIASREATSVIRVPLAAPRAAEPQAQGKEISAEDAPRLVVETTELAGREFACIRTVLTIGRGDECDIVINHRSLSRAHCRLERDGGGNWKVVDLGSSNRVQVNGEEYAESAVHPGDVIALGHVKLRFVAAGEDYVPGGKRSRVPIFVGAALGAAALGGALVFVIAHGKKGPAPTPVAVANPAPAQAKPPSPAATPKPPVAVAEPPPTKAPPAQTKPEEKAPELPEPGTDEVKAPPPDADARKLAAAEAQATQKLKARDPAAGLEILRGVRNLGVGDAQFEAMVKQLEAEKMNQAVIDDTRHGASPDTLRALDDIPETSVFYAEAQRLLAHYEKQVKTAQKNHEKKTEKSAKASAQAAASPPSGEDKAARAAELRQAGMERMRSGDNEGALPILKKAVELDGNSPENLRAIAGCLARLNKFPEAAVYYRRFLQIAPNDPSAPTIQKALKDYQQGK